MTRPESLPAGLAVLRPWRPEDARQLQQQADDRRVWLNMRDAFPHPYGLADGERFIAMATAMSPQTYFAIEVGGQVAGGIGYTLHGDVERIGAEVGYWLGHGFWGRGIATAAVRALTAFAFAAHPELERLYAVPYVSNPASARVLEKAGYRLEGTLRRSAIKDGRVLDQWMYAMEREAGSPAPRAPGEPDAAHRRQPESFRGRALSASLTVRDLGLSLAWYRDVMGFTVDREFERDGKPMAVSLKAGAVRILLTQDDGARGLDRAKGAGFSLQITTAQGIDELAARIKERGGTLASEPADVWGARVFRLQDPDGFKLVISSER